MNPAARCGSCERRRKLVGTDPNGFADELCQECFDERAVTAAENMSDQLRELLEKASENVRSEVRWPFENVLS